MCGIFAIYNDKRKLALQTVFNGLKSLEYRGYDSWGIVAGSDDNRIQIIKEVGKLPPSLPKIKNKKLTSNIALGHTRWATHGGVSKKNCHPHCDCQKEIFVVHNGIIENFNDLKKDLLDKRHRFLSETDTEVFAHLIEEEWKKTSYIKNLSNEFIQKMFRKIEGLNAFIVFLPKILQIFAIKNSSPIVFGIDEKNNQFFLASDYGGIIEYTKKIYFLEDNELLILKEKKFFLYDQKGKKKKPQWIIIDQKKESFSLSDHPHYMIKEIKEQPQVINNILKTKKSEILKLADIIRKSYGNYFIGCGTAYYAALTGTYLFAKIAKRHTNAAVGSEFSYLVNFLTNKSLVIALSQSGETIDIISSVKKIKEKQAKVFAITNVLGSTLYRMADYKILLDAGPEKCVLATKSFTAKIAILILLAFALSGNLDQGVERLKKAVKELKNVIDSYQKIKEIAQLIKNKKHIFVLGRGLSYPLALEAALKIKEVSYIHSEGFPAGELKHGVIALIEKGTPVIVFNPEDETYQDTLSSAFEVKARGGYLIGVSSKKNPVYDQLIEIKDHNETFLVSYIAVAQLLGYYLALALGCDPDKPRNLAKSVTVK